LLPELAQANRASCSRVFALTCLLVWCFKGKKEKSLQKLCFVFMWLKAFEKPLPKEVGNYSSRKLCVTPFHWGHCMRAGGVTVREGRLSSSQLDSGILVCQGYTQCRHRLFPTRMPDILSKHPAPSHRPIHTCRGWRIWDISGLDRWEGQACINQLTPRGFLTKWHFTNEISDSQLTP